MVNRRGRRVLARNSFLFREAELCHDHKRRQMKSASRRSSRKPKNKFDVLDHPDLADRHMSSQRNTVVWVTEPQDPARKDLPGVEVHSVTISLLCRQLLGKDRLLVIVFFEKISYFARDACNALPRHDISPRWGWGATVQEASPIESRYMNTRNNHRRASASLLTWELN